MEDGVVEYIVTITYVKKGWESVRVIRHTSLEATDSIAAQEVATELFAKPMKGYAVYVEVEEM